MSASEAKDPIVLSGKGLTLSDVLEVARQGRELIIRQSPHAQAAGDRHDGCQLLYPAAVFGVHVPSHVHWGIVPEDAVRIRV